MDSKILYRHDAQREISEHCFMWNIYFSHESFINVFVNLYKFLLFRFSVRTKLKIFIKKYSRKKLYGTISMNNYLRNV